MQNSQPRILILTGSFGHGHNTAARNLESAFLQALGPETPVEVVDFFDGAYPVTNRLLKRGYGFAINSAPALWKQLYRLADNRGPTLLPVKAMGRRLQCLLAERQPAALVATFPGYPLLMEQLYARPKIRPFAFFTVITDAISINSVWCQGNPDLVFVTDTWSRDVVEAEGIPRDRVRPHGFPLAPAPNGAGLSPGALPGIPRILYLPTTRTAHVRKTLEALAPWCRTHGAHLTLVQGTHEKRLRPLMQTLQTQLPVSQLVIHGWRDDVPTLMRQSHLTITKAGGATVSETLGALCPVILNYVVPGQEEGNVTLVVRSDCGQRIDDARALPMALTQILIQDQAARWHRYRANLRALDRSNAARRIAEDVLAHPQTRIRSS